MIAMGSRVIRVASLRPSSCVGSRGNTADGTQRLVLTSICEPNDTVTATCSSCVFRSWELRSTGQQWECCGEPGCADNLTIWWIEMNSERLKDGVAIVVGAGSSGPGLGIGQAIARLFADEGARVVLVDLHEDRAAETQRLIAEAGGESIVVAANISEPAACEEVAKRAVAEYGTVSALVNNAAYTPLLGVAETSAETFEKVLAVNVRGPFLMTQATLPAMIERGGGSIVNIGSVASIRSTNGRQAAYASSKAALLGMMVDIANEHGRNGIRINTISPGMIDTPLRRETMREMGFDPESYPFGPQSSLGHAGDAWDMARAALFLVSDDSRFITGVHIPIDGGLTTRNPH